MTPDRSPSARDLAAEMAALADLIDIDPWPEVARVARERLNRETP